LKGSVKISCFLAHTLLLVKGRWADKKWGRKLSMIEWSWPFGPAFKNDLAGS